MDAPNANGTAWNADDGRNGGMPMDGPGGPMGMPRMPMMAGPGGMPMDGPGAPGNGRPMGGPMGMSVVLEVQWECP